MEAAVAVARAGEDDVPAIPAPVGLRPFLHFAKLPPKALVAARRALEVDEDFRARVAEKVTEADVGRAGWLFLRRPEGWEADLAALVKDAEVARAELAEQRVAKEGRRRQATAEAALRRAEEIATMARAEAARANAALAEERRNRRGVSEQAADLARRLSEVTDELEQARAEASAAEREVRQARLRIAELEAQRAMMAAAEAGPGPVAAAPEPPPSTARAGEIAEALGTAAMAARQLADSLVSAAETLHVHEAAAGRVPAVAEPLPPAEPAAPPRPGPRPRPDGGRRVAVPLPPAVLDDSVEAAEHLVRLPGVVMLVDGYNVSNEAWPGTPIADQRRRLVDSLARLAARTGADVRVFFDGAETQEQAPIPTTLRRVRVSFSPPGVEADDVIVAHAGDVPPSRPVVVASSDRRVQDGAQHQGANVILSSQLLGLLR